MSLSFTPSLAHAVSIAAEVLYNRSQSYSKLATDDARELKKAFDVFCDGMKAYRHGELSLSEVRELHAVVLGKAHQFQASSGLELGLFGL